MEKINLPVSPADGAESKQVTVLNMHTVPHPYTRAYLRGMGKMADAFGIELDYRAAQGKVEGEIITNTASPTMLFSLLIFPVPLALE